MNQLLNYLKFDRPIAFFDLETTGTSTSQSRIVQLAITKVFPDGESVSFSRLVNPTISIPKEAAEVHGITDEMVKSKPTFEKIALETWAFIKGCHLSGYNIKKFDIPLLCTEFDRAKQEYDLSGIKIIDVMVLNAKLNPRTLSHCYKQYVGEELEDAHDASADTNATVLILEKMLQSNPEQLGSDLDQLSKFGSYLEDGCEEVDLAGVFYKNEAGQVCYSIGEKTRGKPVSQNLGMLDWIINKDFTNDTKQWAKKIKRGELM